MSRDEVSILHFCPLPLFSGLEQYALKLAIEQRTRGHNVGFVAVRGSELEKECEKAGLTTFIVDFDWAKSLWSASDQYAKILESLPTLKVVHLHSSRDIDRLGLAFLKLRLRGRGIDPKVIQQNHIWISHSKKDPVHWLTHKVLDEVWCSSERARRDIERYLPVPKDRVHVVRYGRDLKITQNFVSREEARRELALPETALVVGAIARIDRAKGIWELLNASASLIERGADFFLVIVGPPTLTDPSAVEFSKKVDDFVSALAPQVRARIRLTGGIPNAGRLLKAFDLYAQVAYKETFSLALLDAQLAELPVVGTDSGGTPEVVRENETGWLAKPEQIDSLRETLVRAFADRSRWKEFGSRARTRVEKDFDINVIVPQILGRYELD